MGSFSFKPPRALRFVLLLGLSAPALAARPPSAPFPPKVCILAWINTYRRQAAVIISPQKLAGSVAETDPQSAWRKLYEAYLEQRRAAVPEGTRQEFNRQAAMLIPSRKAGTYQGEVHRRYGSLHISITLPPELSNTPIDFATRIHELEHVAQDAYGLLREKRVYNEKLAPGSIGDAYDLMRLEAYLEREAITAEWSYLHAIPREQKDALVAAVENLSPPIHPRSLDLALDMLTKSDLPLEEYLVASEGRHYYVNRLRDGLRRNRINLRPMKLSRINVWMKRLEEDPVFSDQDKREIKAVLLEYVTIVPDSVDETPDASSP